MSTEPKSGARITVRAQTPIAAGQEVTVHYISFMYGHFRSVSPASVHGNADFTRRFLMNMATLFQAEEGHRGLLVLQVPVPAMLGPDRFGTKYGHLI